MAWRERGMEEVWQAGVSLGARWWLASRLTDRKAGDHPETRDR